jgi:hypothetical protein
MNNCFLEMVVTKFQGDPSNITKNQQQNIQNLRQRFEYKNLFNTEKITWLFFTYTKINRIIR